ncbi:hypothetical protein HU200_060929 [Digitaria exilis]|uniref:Thaumatin-like protein n=1 Tax=Digitaria exilis TaxID=1010633 RepID=A0A835A5P4_9POAL|nr:hypothetical protein HU200_060929 [Digitaria exilis]
MATTSALFFLLSAFAARANAATFTITNNCGFTVWPAALPVGGGLQLDPTQTWTLNVPAGTQGGRIWGRTGCSFNGTTTGGHCSTGDCAGELSCTVSGQPPATLAEFSASGAQDFYDISVVDGFNIGMAFSCSTGVGLVCRDASCPEAFPNNANSGLRPTSCPANSSYQVTFCP